MDNKHFTEPVPINGRRMYNETRETVRLYNEGLTIAEIAKERGTSTTAVTKCLQERGTYFLRPTLTPEEKKRIVWLIITGEPIEEIGLMYDRTPESVMRMVNDAGYYLVDGKYVKTTDPKIVENPKYVGVKKTEAPKKQKPKRKPKKIEVVEKPVQVEDEKSANPFIQFINLPNKKSDKEIVVTMKFKDEFSVLMLDELMKIDEGKKAIDRKGIFAIVKEIETAVDALMTVKAEQGQR